MAVLSNNARALLWAQVMQEYSAQRLPIPVLKAELRAAIDAADDWADANAAEYNTALPQPFRGAASAKLKALVLMLVLAERHDVTA